MLLLLLSPLLLLSLPLYCSVPSTSLLIVTIFGAVLLKVLILLYSLTLIKLKQRVRHLVILTIQRLMDQGTISWESVSTCWLKTVCTTGLK